MLFVTTGRPLSSPRRLALAFAASFLVFACSGTPEADATPSAPAAAAPTAEESVRPGANTRFLDPELDVDQFVKMFEGESREIALQRAGIVAQLNLRSGLDVADVGAGTGLFMEPFAEAVGPTGTVYAVDISPGFMEHLQERAKTSGWPQVQTVLCAEDSVNLPADSIDLAFICDTYHHFEYPMSTLTSLYSALRPGGRLVIVDFERIPGVSRDWVLDHVRIGRVATIAEVVDAGFEVEGVLAVDGLSENYMVAFRRPGATP
jgi:SAM-dependent methyltransferase